MFQSLLQQCRLALGIASNSSTPARRRPRRRVLALEGLEERTVLTAGGHPVDLVLNGFQLDEKLSTDNDTLLTATVTITNSSSYRSKAFDITFYASADLSFYQRGTDDLLLRRYFGPSLDPGESVTIVRKIPDPVFYDNNYLNGYYIGVHIDANQRIHETNDSNNALLHNPCTPEMIQHSRATMATVFLGFGVVVGGTAYNHLGNFIYGSGNPRDWAPGSNASNLLLNEDGYKDSVERASMYVNKELRKNAAKTNQLYTSVSVPTRYVGKPKLGSDSLDLAYAIGGTQGSSGIARNIQLVSVENVGNRRKVTYTADIYITYTDRYNFDTQDSRKWLGNYARHLEMAGAAKPFNVSITAMTTVTQSFTI